MKSTPSTTRRDDAEREALLKRYVLSNLSLGKFTIAYQEPFMAILNPVRKVNHILHVILSIVTVGLWLPIWLLVTLGENRKTLTLTVDEFGNIHLDRN